MEDKIVEIIKENWFDKFPEENPTEGQMSSRGASKAAQGIVKLCNMHIVTNPVKIIDWKHTDQETPLVYKTGEWDGMNSDNVVAEDKNGKQYLAYYTEGFMDGSKFSDWYTANGWHIIVEIVRWLPIPS